MSKFHGATGRDFWANVFGHREPEQLEQELENLDEQSLETRREGKKFNRPSLYVKVFEDMVNVIMEKETHLLSDAEWDMLKVYRKLDYRVRYLLVRLVFRQPDWHALSSLDKYSAEIGEEELAEALKTLCVPVKEMKFDVSPSPPPSTEAKRETQEECKIKEENIVDLTSMDDEELPIPPLRLGLTQKPTQISLQKPAIKTSDHEIEEPVVDPENLVFDYLFRDQSTMTVREALTRLTLPDLREIQKSMKVGTPTMRKELLINAMINHATGQKTLPSIAKKTGKSSQKQTRKDDGMLQTQLSFGQKPKDMSQMKRLREMALARLGPCVKINPNLYWLVGRLHIIAYRGIEKPTKLCLPALLAGFKKWNFPEYKYERTGSIWPTREDLLEYEEALYLDVEMENPPEDGSNSTGPAPETRLKTPATPAKEPATPLRTPQTGKVTATPKTEDGEPALPLQAATEEPEVEGRASQTVQRARHATKLYKERIEAKWKLLLARKDLEKGKTVMRAPGLERFEAGHVYTRMAHKAATAYGSLKEHHKELAILVDLLEQTHWRKGKRATWYERRALILEKYICPTDYETIKNGILQALADEYTGLISRPSLARRLDRIQKKMKLHPEKWIKCDVILKSPSTIEFKAKRSELKPGVKLDQNYRPMMGNVPLLTDFFQRAKPPEQEVEIVDPKNPNVTVIQLLPPKAPPKRTGKSSWIGFSDESVNVETYALQRYEMEGYVGFHSETRILTTIFGLVFWDIIFSSVPGAFETQFQAGPLDMFEESFYLARHALFEARLKEIEDGKAGEYLKRHDDRFRPKQTWCIGLRWDVCEQKQLLEIVKCLGAKTVAMICKLFCEDYAGRSSGVPDLIVWKADEGICKFVEVKGPGDSPQPNQKLWFDSLMRAGAHVEICRIIDQDAPEQNKRKRKTPASKPNTKGRKRKGKDISSDREEPQEQRLDSDDDGDYLPEPQSKRRKLGVDGDGRCAKAMTPMSPLTNALPGTPLSGRRARSISVEL
ncbi:hypothetical protein D9756_001293 [Leucocoprinus leucothites]|uniref:Fanconi-associated nuclease n=1 Tax=Leucocoprinus leucothites TaxID=201217 RepID=A0A8H5LI72_9AGAR|nr:hypothetical protein D9756_001293 [Leucoagaricus leucothites]